MRGCIFNGLLSRLTMSPPVLAAGLIALVVCAFSPANAMGDLNQNLCQYNPVRGPVPAHYALDACVDGNSIVIRNDGDFPVQLIARRAPDGHTVSPLTFVTKATSSYASETRKAHSNKLPGTMVLPGDRVSYEDGDYSATIRAAINVKDYDGYVMAKIMSNFIPIVGQTDAFKDLVAALRESRDQYSVCRSRGGLHRPACVARREARQVSAIVTFVLDVAPGRTAVLKLAKKIYNLLPAWLQRHDPETALNGYDTVLTQGPRDPCFGGVRLMIVGPIWVSDTPSMNVATAGAEYYAAFESILSTPVEPWGSAATDWVVSGVPGFHIGWTSSQGMGGTNGNMAEVAGPATTPGSYSADVSATYRSRLTGQTCAVTHYTYPVVVTEPPPPAP